jgi:hypothetical protein
MNMNMLRFYRGGCLAVLASVCSTGCATRTVLLEGHRVFPAEPRFTIAPREYSPDELAAAGVRVDGVYVDVGWRPVELQELEEAEFARKGWRTGSPFYRFWPSGHVMSRLPHTDALSSDHVDSFERARLGYFEIATNGVVETELFLYDPGRGGYSYFKKRRTIEGDTIWSDTGRMHKGEAVQLGYRFVPIEGMKAEPDW